MPVTRDWTTAGFTPSVTAPVVPPPLRPVPAVTSVMSPPLSLSTSSAKPAGLPAMPAHGVVLLKAAFGAGASSCRGVRVV